MLSLSGLERSIRDLRADDPLLPVAVVVPNHLLGVWLSQRLFADTGHMAIDFVLAHELAWRVAAPGLLREGRARVPENVGLALLLGAIPEAIAHPDTPDYLREAAETAGFGPAALRTIEDLAGAEPAARSTSRRRRPRAADPERLRLVARLWRGVRSRPREGPPRSTARSLYRAAAQALPSPLARRGRALRLRRPVAGRRRHSSRRCATHHPFALGWPTPSRRRARRATPRVSRRSQRVSPTPVRRSSRGSRADGRPRRAAGAGCSPRRTRAATTPDRRSTPASRSSPPPAKRSKPWRSRGSSSKPPPRASATRRSPSSCAAPTPTASPSPRPSTAPASTRSSSKAFPRVDPAARGLSLLLDLVGADLDRAPRDGVPDLGPHPVGERPRPRSRRQPRRAGTASRPRPASSRGLDAWRTRLARGARRPRGPRVRRRPRPPPLRQPAPADRPPRPATSRPFPRAAPGPRSSTPRSPSSTPGSSAPTSRASASSACSRPLAQLRAAARAATSSWPACASCSPPRSTARARSATAASSSAPSPPPAACASAASSCPASSSAPSRPSCVPTRCSSTTSARRCRRTCAPRATARRPSACCSSTPCARRRSASSCPTRASTPASGRERVPSSFLLQALEAALGRRIGAGDLARLAIARRDRPRPPASRGPGAGPRPHRARPGPRRERPARAPPATWPRPTASWSRSLAQERASWEPSLTAWDGIVDVAAAPEALARLRLAGQRSSASAVAGLRRAARTATSCSAA